VLQSEAEAVLLGCRFPPPSEEEIASLPGAAAAWQKFPEGAPRGRAVAEARRAAVQEAERALDVAIREAHKAKQHPLAADQIPAVLSMLGGIRKTIDKVAAATGRPPRQSARFSGTKPGLDTHAIISKYSK
jgi:hypothetical protein